MSNIHGLNNQPNNRPNQRRAQLNQNNQHQNDQNISMLGMTETDLRLMGNEIANNRIPFVNIMSESISPLDQSIPYTLRLVWCPGFTLLSFSTLVLLMIWIMYIVCLSEGIDTRSYLVLAPTPQALRKYGAFNYQLLKDGEVWRLIAAVVLHEDLLQITMSTLLILFFVTQLQQCYNPLVIGVALIVAAISGNITLAVFGDKITLHAGAGTMIYGALGGFFGYLAINWTSLYLIRTQLCCMFGMLFFFGMLFSIGSDYGFSGFVGALMGGFCCSLAVFPGIRPKGWIYIAAGVAGIVLYWLMMFLIFYLAV